MIIIELHAVEIIHMYKFSINNNILMSNLKTINGQGYNCIHMYQNTVKFDKHCFSYLARSHNKGAQKTLF